MKQIGQRTLAIYSGALTALVAVMLLTGFSRAESTRLDEITVQRINVVEPDGTVRMIISNHAKLPGIIVRGREEPFERPQAGMIFYNDEGSEVGGLIFGGRRNTEGNVVNSGGSLTFDRYDAYQIIQLAGVDDSEDRFVGLRVLDSHSGSDTRRRIWVGREDGGPATVALMDGNGRRRLVMEVTTDGDASLSFLDADGTVVRRVTPSNSAQSGGR